MGTHYTHCFIFFFFFHLNLSGVIPYLLICYVKSFQSCLTLCNPMDCNLPGFSVHGILQARILKWVAMPSSRDLPNPGIKPISPESPALAGRFFTAEPPRKPIAFLTMSFLHTSDHFYRREVHFRCNR